MEDYRIMSTISNIGKIAYIYDEALDTWHPVAGMTDTSADFSWTGEHSFSEEVVINNSLDVNGNILVKGSLNYFGSAALRDSAIPSPSDGAFALVSVSGSIQLQTYSNGSWRIVGSNAFLLNRAASYTLAMSDGGRTLDFASSSPMTVTIPVNSVVAFPIGTQIAFIQSGTGQISFVGATVGLETATILSKNNNKRTATQYTQSILVKRDTNSWYLFGDLTA
jgi:hypothetical protein